MTFYIVSDIRKRVLFTLGLLGVYRIVAALLRTAR